MKSDKELFDLAKRYAHLEGMFEVAAIEFEIEEIKEAMEEILSTLLEKRYDADKFVYYKNMYKEMTIGEYLKFIKTLKQEMLT